MQYRGRYHDLAKKRTMLLRCESLEPSMPPLGHPRRSGIAGDARFAGNIESSSHPFSSWRSKCVGNALTHGLEGGDNTVSDLPEKLWRGRADVLSELPQPFAHCSGSCRPATVPCRGPLETIGRLPQ